MSFAGAPRRLARTENAVECLSPFKVIRVLDLHPVHVQGKGPAGEPLLSLHRWPGSVPIPEHDPRLPIQSVSAATPILGHADRAFPPRLRSVFPAEPGSGPCGQEMGRCFADLMTGRWAPQKIQH